MHARMTLGDDAEQRAVRALRAARRTPDVAARWEQLDPVKRLAYVLRALLDLNAGCCEHHDEVARQVIRRFLTSRACPHVLVRRRASEILAAVALVDDHPPCATPSPPRFEHGKS